jgi:UDP-N-acetylmuramoyl-L-alanyl-D-glutamate--2,6-diaminopimelate ligase
VTSDNPRSENPMDIINMIIPGVEQTGTPYKVICDRKEAIRYALEIACTGDVVILAGKGHETYQILNEGTIEFDEREIVSEILKG